MHTIPPEQCQRRLRAENPWWSGSPARTDKFYRDMKPRAYFKRFAALVEERDVRRAVVLMGPRRVGKTVLLQHMIQKLLKNKVPPRTIACASLDQPLYANLSIEELVVHIRQESGLCKGEATFLFLDEIQYLRDWERHLKVFVDAHPKIKCIVSGSAAAALRLKSIESGAGRCTDFLLPPLTFHEYLDLQNIKGLCVKKGSGWACSDIHQLNRHFVNYIHFGGYPEVIFSQAIRKDIGRFVRSDIIDKVLLRDLPSLYGIQDIQELNLLFMTLAWNTAGEVSLDGLSHNSGVSKPTLKRYLEYLEAAFLIKIVHRIDHNAKRFKRANFFKVYLTNPSMRCALFGPTDEDSPDMGALAETAVFSQWFHARLNLHYARWRYGEVDIVHLNNQQQPAWCVEVKWSDRVASRREELAPLIAFIRKHPEMRASFTTRTKKGVLPGDSKVDYMPTSLYCYMVGYNLVSGREITFVGEE